VSGGVILFVLFFALIVFGVPIGYAIGVSALAAILSAGLNPIIFITSALAGSNSFTLMAVPFFMLAGNLMATGGVAKRIVNFFNSFVGNVTGGLSIVTTAACMFFGALSGSAVATTSAIGSFMIPEMEKRGYDKDFAATLAASAGTVGVIIPPSVPFVIYAVAVNVSVKDLFIAGIIPGIMMGISLIVVCLIISHKRGWRGNVGRFSLREVWKTFKEGFFALLMPVIILGGIYGGIFTATEASVVSVVYCVIISIYVYKEMTWRDVYKTVRSMVGMSGVTMFMMGFANAFSYYLSLERIPNAIAATFLGISDNPFIILLMINVMLLLVGCVIDNIPATIILSPILLRVVEPLGMSPITFGVLLTMNLAIGFVTPPYGIDLFVASAVSGVPIENICKRVIPFICALLVVLMLITYVPWFTMCFLSK
jgi:C4-dicarboxylate transporter DctM subunit